MEIDFVFVRIALDRSPRGDGRRSERSLALAKSEIGTIKRVERQIADTFVRRRIHSIVDEFDHLLGSIRTNSTISAALH